MDKQQNIERMWQTLEQEQKAPQNADLLHLSNLLEEDIQRFSKAWQNLTTQERQKLIEALNALAENDFEVDFNAIFRLALQDKDATIREVAIDSLWEDEDVRLIPELIHFLQEDEVEKVRLSAAQGLAHFILLGETKKIRPRPFEMACKALLNTCRDREESIEVRRRALESLAYAGLKEVEDLIQEAYLHPEESMKLSAVFAMGRSANDQWKKTIIRELQNSNPAMRYEATRACGELAAREAVSEIIELTEDVDIEVQETALWALGQIGGNQARQTLKCYTQSENEALREAAIDALNELEFFHGDLDSLFNPPDSFEEEDEDWDLLPPQNT